MGVSRRAFLGAAGAAGTATLVGRSRLGVAGALAEPSAEEIEIDVAVVGHTLSGLVAAAECRRAGLSVAVLGGAGAPAGEQERWLLAGHRALIGLARQVGVRVESLLGDRRAHEVVDGEMRPLPEGALSHDTRAAAEMASALVKLDRMAAEVDPDAPWAGVNAAVRDGQSLAAWLDLSVAGSPARRRLDQGFELAFGAPASEVSLLFALMVVGSTGGSEALLRAAYSPSLAIGGGLAAVSERLARRLAGSVLPYQVGDAATDGKAVTLQAPGSTVIARHAIAADLSGPGVLGRGPVGRFVPGTLALAGCTYAKGPGRGTERAVRVVGDGAPVHAVQPIDGGRTLVAVIAGGAARRWARLDEAERKRAVLDALGRWFGPPAAGPARYREFTGTSAARVVGLPGAVMSAGPDLRAPANRVHRAGPETAMSWIGHGEGLVEAGKRAAAEVTAREG
jgi:monoamine oxidase